MRRTVSILLVACSLVSLSLVGCGEDNEKTANLKGVPAVIQPGEDPSPGAQKKKGVGVKAGAKTNGGTVAYPKAR